MIGAYRFDMCGTPRIAAEGILYGGYRRCAARKHPIRAERTGLCPRLKLVFARAQRGKRPWRENDNALRPLFL